MSYRITNTLQHDPARVAGFMYLFPLTIGFFSSFMRYVVWEGDAAKTANQIMASEQRFRMMLASDLIAFASIVLLALALYILLKPVNKILALLALFWWLGEAFILGINTLNDYVVLVLLSGADYLSVFDESQLQALVRVFLLAHGTGYNIGLIFFGLGSTVFSYLLFKSNYVPRFLAGWGIFASLGILIGTFAVLIFPNDAEIYQLISGPPMLLYEFIIGFWLLIKGVNVEEWEKRALESA